MSRVRQGNVPDAATGLAVMGVCQMAMRGNMRAQRASYQRMVEWIAEMDESAELDQTVISEFITVCMLSDTLDKPRMEIAADVLKIRKKLG